MYAIKYSKEDMDCHQRFRGLKKSIVKKDLTFHSFEMILKGLILPLHEIHNLRARLFDVYLEKSSKASLSLFEDKRHWVNQFFSYAYGNIHTLPFHPMPAPSIDQVDPLEFDYEPLSPVQADLPSSPALPPSPGLPPSPMALPPPV